MSWWWLINNVETCSTIKHTAVSTVITYLSTRNKFHGYQIFTVIKTVAVVFVAYGVWKNKRGAYKLWIAFFYGCTCLVHMSFHCYRPNYPKTVRLFLMLMHYIMSILMNWESPRRTSLKSQRLYAHDYCNAVLITLKHQFLLWIICHCYFIK